MVTYEVDLCTEHAAELTSTIEQLIKNSRQLGQPARSFTPPTTNIPPRAQAPTSQVRAWAKQQGIEVSERGRIPDEIFEQYLASRH